MHGAAAIADTYVYNKICAHQQFAWLSDTVPAQVLTQVSRRCAACCQYRILAIGILARMLVQDVTPLRREAYHTQQYTHRKFESGKQ